MVCVYIYICVQYGIVNRYIHIIYTRMPLAKFWVFGFRRSPFWFGSLPSSSVLSFFSVSSCLGLAFRVQLSDEGLVSYSEIRGGVIPCLDFKE